MTVKLGTTFKRSPDPGVRRPDGSIEPWANLGEWDRPHRRKDGRPMLLVKHAYQSAWARAIALGLSLTEAIELANAEADRVAAQMNHPKEIVR